MLLSLARTNDPVLRTPAKAVQPEEMEDLKPVITSMFNLLDLAGGIGLAAPQVGIDKSLFVISIEGDRRVFVNPAVLSTSEITQTEPEGCLSLPGLELKITRPARVTGTWLNEDGVAQVADLEGLWARCWLHEFDHLQGIMIDDRVSKLTLDMARRKLAKRKKQGKRS